MADGQEAEEQSAEEQQPAEEGRDPLCSAVERTHGKHTPKRQAKQDDTGQTEENKKWDAGNARTGRQRDLPRIWAVGLVCCHPLGRAVLRGRCVSVDKRVCGSVSFVDCYYSCSSWSCRLPPSPALLPLAQRPGFPICRRTKISGGENRKKWKNGKMEKMAKMTGERGRGAQLPEMWARVDRRSEASGRRKGHGEEPEGEA